MTEGNGFVADGHERARQGNEPIVRAEVQRQYAAKLDAASPVERTHLNAEIEREIQTRLDKLAPPDALY